MTIHRDGSQTVVYDRITREQQIAEYQERLKIKASLAGGSVSPDALTLVGDSYNGTQGNCSGTLAMFWDGTEYTGNEICFENEGSTLDDAYLLNYYREVCGRFCTRTEWSGAAVGSWDVNAAATALTNKSTWPIYHCVGCSCSSLNDGSTETIDGSTAGNYTGQDYLWMEPYGTIANICNL